ncbi:tRNA pseudouridine(55) synthase TruB [Bacillus sp. FSL K6-3431]|uniref:tRNA pseudouridine(55) synthase TruB n=1 Tax=Bacillus sp. FSL K6-3431 TaxID=2921500 RepID=UPI0030FB841C
MEGILPLWKPKGLTSHDCVFKIRKMLKMKKVGHTGTLDPDVEGVLPICLGRATKIAEYITEAGKVYEGEVTIGFSTTTEDSSGDIVEEKRISQPISIDEISAVLHSLTGQITQTPPMFSAVKVNGKKLYEYARAGIEIERPARTVSIYELELLEDLQSHENGLLSFKFRVSCSKGTYIRTLAVMMGEKLGYPAHMSKLVRVASAAFTEQDCVTFEQLESMITLDTLDEIIFPLEKGLEQLSVLEIDDKTAEKVKNGAVLNKPEIWPDGQVSMFYKGKVIAIYQLHPENKLAIKPVKVLRIN